MKSLKQTSFTNIALWDDKAEDWHGQVGEEGDRNRRFNSDPVLWKFLGPVRGCSVLDAGCGTGYLSRRLSAEGARVLTAYRQRDMCSDRRRENRDSAHQAPRYYGNLGTWAPILVRAHRVAFG